MNVSVFGLGYVGAVSAACLARDGHNVIGVDVNPDKVALVQKGDSPIVEANLQELLSAGVSAGRISATTSALDAVQRSELSMVSVGTPPTLLGAPDLSYVYQVCREIADAVRAKGTHHIVVIRSTVPPGTTKECTAVMAAIVDASLIHVAFNPEFLREGSAIEDYDNPPYTVIGCSDSLAEAAIRDLYSGVKAPFISAAPEIAEMVKYIANAWHATKIGFANEIGRIAKSFGVDGRDAMRIAVQDTKLNISAAYMRPGFAYGGSCLPKDLGALTSIARARHVPIPLLNSLSASNNVQVERAVEEVMRNRPRAVAVFGLAFKPGTDDLRESPAVALVKLLIGEGCNVRIHDRDVYQARLMGTNLAYIRSKLPHFEELLEESPDAALASADTVVLTYASKAFVEPVLRHPNVRVVDLSGTFDVAPPGRDYVGSAW